jgi:hypothetical protein
MRLGCPNLFFWDGPLVQHGMHIAAHNGPEMAVKKACTIGLRSWRVEELAGMSIFTAHPRTLDARRCITTAPNPPHDHAFMNLREPLGMQCIIYIYIYIYMYIP